MTASLQRAGRQKYILQYVSWFTVSSTFYSQVNHKFEGRSVGEDSLRQMFVKSHALTQKHIRLTQEVGVRGGGTPEPESSVTHEEPHEEAFIHLPAPPLLCFHFVHTSSKMLKPCRCETFAKPVKINLLNVVLIGHVGALHLSFTFSHQLVTSWIWVPDWYRWLHFGGIEWFDIKRSNWWGHQRVSLNQLALPFTRLLPGDCKRYSYSSGWGVWWNVTNAPYVATWRHVWRDTSRRTWSFSRSFFSMLR